MYFLGIDPSATSTGLALIGEKGQYVFAGTILPKQRRGGERLAYIRDTVPHLLRPYLGQITQAVIEAPAYERPLKADLLGQVRGLFLLKLYDYGIPVLLAPPSSVKKFATGRGLSDKNFMVKTAQGYWPQWPGTDKSDDEADALWMAELARGIHFPNGMTRSQLEVLHKLKQLEVEDDV